MKLPDYNSDLCGPGCTPAIHKACLGPHPWAEQYQGGIADPGPEPPGGGCEQCFRIGELVESVRAAYESRGPVLTLGELAHNCGRCGSLLADCECGEAE